MKEKLDDVIRSFSEFIKWPEYDIVTICMGTALANIAQEGDAVFLFIIGPPSSGKTELIRGFKGLPHFFELSKVTPHTFISGFMERGKKKGSENSLLNKLKKADQRIIMIKDFTSMLGERADVKSNVFSQLREIADGYCSTPYGTGENVSWEGKIGIIAGVTGAIDESAGTRSALGERFLGVRVGKLDHKKAASSSAAYTGLESACREMIANAIKVFMENVDVGMLPEALNLIDVSEEIHEKLFAGARLLSVSRTGVNRDKYSRVLSSLPEPEGPSRLIRQLVHIGKGIAYSLGKPAIDEEIYLYLKRIIRDSIPNIRERCIWHMWNTEIRQDAQKQSTSRLSKMVGQERKTIYAWLEDLRAVEMLQSEVVITENGKETRWWLSTEAFDMIQASEIYGVDECTEPPEDFDSLIGENMEF